MKITKCLKEWKINQIIWRLIYWMKAFDQYLVTNRKFLMMLFLAC